jgi:hypothetical protein
MKTARKNTGQEKFFVFSLVYLTGSIPVLLLLNNSTVNKNNEHIPQNTSMKIYVCQRIFPRYGDTLFRYHIPNIG